jgi:hypothetical protein
METENALENVAGEMRNPVSSKMKRVFEKALATKQCAPSHEC